MNATSSHGTQHYQRLLVFVAVAIPFCALLLWLLHNHYSSDNAVYNWVVTRALLDGGIQSIENVDVDLVYGQLALLSPFYMIPALLPLSQYFVAVIAASLLLSIWHQDLAKCGYRGGVRFLMLALFMVNPAVMWCVTNGNGSALSLLILYMLHKAILQVVNAGEIRAYITVGLLMALYVQFDSASLYLLAVLLPLMILFTPARRKNIAPHSTYIIIGLPLVVMVASWLYFNWVFHEKALAFLNNPHSAFLGARPRAEEVSWLVAYGGQFFKPFAIGLVYVVAGYPILLYLLWRSHRQGGTLQANIAIIYYPALAIGLATLTYYLATPLQILVLVNALIMAEIARPGESGHHPTIPVLLCLVLGLAGNWYLFARDEDPQVKAWLASLGEIQQESGKGEGKLGAWLAEHRDATLMDLRSGYQVVAARGDAIGLVTPYNDDYRLMIRSGQPAAPQIVIPNPDSFNGGVDELNKIFPDMYESGMRGYRLVYDEDGWRVYRKI